MRLQERYNLFLYIDDAHGISILGAQGEGFARGQLPDELGPRTIVAASLGKGFGASGGVLMLGSWEQEDVVRRYAQPYAFSAAPNLARSEEHTSELQSLMRISYAVFCLKKKKTQYSTTTTPININTNQNTPTSTQPHAESH